jgi:hypothetical protein
VEFLNGEAGILTLNIIAENLLEQVHDKGHRQAMIGEIEDHWVLDDAVPDSQETHATASDMKHKKRTTQGWELSVRWKAGSTDWITLKDLKDTCSMELEDHAIANKIDDEPALTCGGCRMLLRSAKVLCRN